MQLVNGKISSYIVPCSQCECHYQFNEADVPTLSGDSFINTYTLPKKQKPKQKKSWDITVTGHIYFLSSGAPIKFIVVGFLFFFTRFTGLIPFSHIIAKLFFFVPSKAVSLIDV